MRALASVKSRPIFSLCGTGWLRNEEINLLSAERNWAPCRLRRPRTVARTRRASPEVIKLLPARAALAEPSPAWESRSSDDTRSILGDFRIFYLMGLVAPVAASCWRSRFCMSKKPRRGPSTLMRRTISTIPGSLVNPGVADKMAMSEWIDPPSAVAESTEIGSTGASLGKDF
jgi:hypothetical protein